MKPTTSPLIQSARLIAVASLALALTGGLRAADPAPAADAKKLTFTADIKPLLTKYCYSCHGGDDYATSQGKAAGSMSKSKLTLDTYENALKGGRSGKAGIVAGKPADSEIIRRISLPADDKQIMPQKGKPAPTAAEIKLITDWVAAGAAK
jgi:mono/diheme cytochrome c family protein